MFVKVIKDSIMSAVIHQWNSSQISVLSGQKLTFLFAFRYIWCCGSGLGALCLFIHLHGKAGRAHAPALPRTWRLGQGANTANTTRIQNRAEQAETATLRSKSFFHEEARRGRSRLNEAGGIRFANWMRKRESAESSADVGQPSDQTDLDCELRLTSVVWVSEREWIHENLFWRLSF